MRVVLQRVKHASVHVDGRETGSIGQGFLILLGVSDEDDETIADKMADKICRLRIFEDENGKTTVRALLVQERRTMRTVSMNILWNSAKSMWKKWRTGSSERI